MRLKIVKLYFLSPLHLGDIGVDLSGAKKYWHSDGVFSALFNALVLLFPDKIDEIREDLESVKISSAFPFFEDEIFLPAFPTVFLNQEDFADCRKKVKKLEFFPKSYFERIAKGEILKREDCEFMYRHTKEVYKIRYITRNRINRLTGKTGSLDEETAEEVGGGLYTIGALEFLRKDAGLYFAIDCDEKIFKRYIEPALKLLQDQGVGGDHTVGFGRFKYRVDEVNLNLPSSTKTFLSISSVLPTQDDIEKMKNFPELRWDFVMRGGYPFFSFSKKIKARKPRFMMVKEGSILPKNIQGQIYEMDTGDFVAYHYGKAFLIPVQIRNEEDS